MNNYILINRTFSETTPESLEDGEFSNTGFISENEAVSFTELVELMQSHYHASQYPNDGNVNVWYSCEWYCTHYGKGIDRQETIHYSANNTENCPKYWKLANIIAQQKINRS